MGSIEDNSGSPIHVFLYEADLEFLGFAMAITDNSGNTLNFRSLVRGVTS